MVATLPKPVEITWLEKNVSPDTVRVLSILSAAPVLTDDLAVELVKRFTPTSHEKARSLVEALHLCDFVVKRSSGWNFREDARAYLQSLMESAEARPIHAFLLKQAQISASNAERSLPSYLVNGVGEAYHGTELSSGEGLPLYARLAKIEYMKLASDGPSGKLWMLSVLAEEQQRRGTMPANAIEPSFLRGLTLHTEGQTHEAITFFERIVENDEERIEIAIACQILGELLWSKDQARAESLLTRCEKIAERIGETLYGAQVLGTRESLQAKSRNRREEEDRKVQEGVTARSRDKRSVPNAGGKIGHSSGRGSRGFGVPAMAKLPEHAVQHTIEWPEESGVLQAHNQGIKGAGVMLGILDTGVDADHPEHQDRLIQFRYVSLFPSSPQNPARDVRGFDPDGHGTHVAGIAAGSFHGVAPEVDLYVASVIESENIRTSLGRVAAGVEWLLHQFSRPENANRPAVLCMSLGLPVQPPTGVSDMEYRLNIRSLRTLLCRLVESNVLPVVAAGNGGAGTAGYPAAFPEVLSVGAVDFSRRVASFSASGAVNQRAVPDVMGYGVNVYSSTERRANNQAFYERMSGTSMAAPYVAGLAALYRCRSPDLTAIEIRDLILDNALKLPKNPRGRVGQGLAIYK